MGRYLDASGVDVLWSKVKSRIDSSVSALRNEVAAVKLPYILGDTVPSQNKLKEVYDAISANPTGSFYTTLSGTRLDIINTAYIPGYVTFVVCDLDGPRQARVIKSDDPSDGTSYRLSIFNVMQRTTNMDMLTLGDSHEKYPSSYAVKNAISSAISASDASLVHKTGDETVSGNKTFTDGITCGATFTPYVSVEYISIDDHHGNGDTFFWTDVTDYDIDGNIINAYDSFDHNLEPSLERVWIRPDDASASVFYKYDEMDGWIPDPNFRDLYDVGNTALDTPTVKIGGAVWSDVVGNALDALSIAKSRNPKLVAGSNITISNNPNGTQTISAKTVNVVDSLDSDSSTDALSAGQGKAMGEMITFLWQGKLDTDERLDSFAEVIQSNIESISGLSSNLGNPAELTTTNKSSLVAAVNEVNGKVADCSARVSGISRTSGATHVDGALYVTDPDDVENEMNVARYILHVEDMLNNVPQYVPGNNITFTEESDGIFAISATSNAKPMTSVNYATLKSYRDAGTLVPGMQYRITDYNCTTSQENTQSAGHAFDIIVTADSSTMLNENARAVRHAGDTYFANSKLEAWELKYSIDNDADRFAWANINGKGVIYYMKDEWNNECPYDFKNIMFNGDWGYYAYTFNWINDESSNSCEDLSVAQFAHLNDEGGFSHTYGNIIRPYGDSGSGSYGLPYRLNFIVFLNTESYDGGLYYGCHSNTFGDGCYDNIFGNLCLNNTFGVDCHSNTFGNSCESNTFGNDCYRNTFENGCCRNTFGDGCASNTFGNICRNNTFGDGCESNTFGNSCYSNTFGNSCSNNTFRNGCGINDVGNDCCSNTFGDDCVHVSVAKEYSRYITVDNGVTYVDVTCSATTSSSKYAQNARICSGISGTSSAQRTCTLATAGNSFLTTFANDSSGNLVSMNIADLYRQLEGVDAALSRING